MEVVRLKNVKLANAIKVDIENTVFKNDNYDILLVDKFFIVVKHRLGKITTSTVHNMINLNYEDDEILNALFSNPKAAAPVKVAAPIPEPEAPVGPLMTAAERNEVEKSEAAKIEEMRRLAKIADREKRMAAKGAPIAVVPLTVARAKKSNKTNSGV